MRKALSSAGSGEQILGILDRRGHTRENLPGRIEVQAHAGKILQAQLRSRLISAPDIQPARSVLFPPYVANNSCRRHPDSASDRAPGHTDAVQLLTHLFRSICWVRPAKATRGRIPDR